MHLSATMGLVIFLILLALHEESTATSLNTSGKNFIIAFPENIAHYHPNKPENHIIITALYDNTNVVLKEHTFNTQTKDLSAGETTNLQLKAAMELKRQELTNRTVIIESTKTIVVYAISKKIGSIQSALVVPTDNLGTEYHIPSWPQVTSERGFKIIIINADKDNTVTLVGAETQKALLRPYQLAQFAVSESMRSLSAVLPVAVLFSHPCSTIDNCTCGMLSTPLAPTRAGLKLQFLVPPLLAENAESGSLLLLKPSPETYSPQALSLQTLSPVVFYRPGMLLSLISIQDFSSCFILNPFQESQDIKNFALLIVPKDQTDGVHLETLPLSNVKWEVMDGTEYSWAEIGLTQKRHVIWHTSSKIAVYFIGKKESLYFGNAASSISKYPDFKGCVVAQEALEIGAEKMGWPESVQYCRSKGLELMNIVTSELQQHIGPKLMEAKTDEQKEAWIGLRRSSLTGNWYWVNGTTVENTSWAEGEPGTPQDGQCAIMSLDPTKGFGWSDEDCCKAAHPICYRSPHLFPLT